ncbi:MAG: Gfo/Idh/MocA family oxidoreductase [Calothrix sp. MO_167.B42]|nr:Gfo/Idh/MocA family oxidoreductase [Calothrix sp. MO_167.B42]
MHTSTTPYKSSRIKVGLVGIGYAAKTRAKALHSDEIAAKAQLVAVCGHSLEKTTTFAQEFNCTAIATWQELVTLEDIDLVIISTINRDHGIIAKAALSQDKHVVVEYPLALDVGEAEEIIALAQTQKKLLHVEHIEVLGGVHQAIKQNLPHIGQIFYARYSTIKSQLPAPRKWSYNHQMFGFPLMAALSRVHRLVDLFGPVLTVNCHNRFWQTDREYYQGCICVAQLQFESGLLGNITYAKGETLWHTERRFEIHGENGGITINKETGVLLRAGDSMPMEIASRRGLFAKDTAMVLDHLIRNTPLYITPTESLYTLKVADAARRSAQTGLTMTIN